jgi:hypothetical protein
MSREMPQEEMSRLSASMEALRRGRRVRGRPTAHMLRQAAEKSSPSRSGAAA